MEEIIARVYLLFEALILIKLEEALDCIVAVHKGKR